VDSWLVVGSWLLVERRHGTTLAVSMRAIESIEVVGGMDHDRVVIMTPSGVVSVRAEDGQLLHSTIIHRLEPAADHWGPTTFPTFYVIPEELTHASRTIDQGVSEVLD
jgi:hypothetical protein